jgi:hypothetical protein
MRTLVRLGCLSAGRAYLTHSTNLATTLWLCVIFDTAGEVLEALVGCLGVVTVSHRNMEVYHAAPDADWTYPP